MTYWKSVTMYVLVSITTFSTLVLMHSYPKITVFVPLIIGWLGFLLFVTHNHRKGKTDKSLIDYPLVLFSAIGLVSLFIFLEGSVTYITPYIGPFSIVGSLFFSVCIPILLGWVGVLSFVTHNQSKGKTGESLLILSVLALAAMFYFFEWVKLMYLFQYGGAMGLGLLFYWDLRARTKALSYMYKPFRRTVSMVWVLDLYAIMTLVFGLSLFFIQFPFVILTIIGAIATMFVSYQLWRLYYPISFQRLLFWILLVGIVMLELIWVVHVLPFGHFVSAFFVVWVWYVLQLLLRFHMNPKGLIWKKQQAFLILNSILFISFLFFIRWI